jgi:hypothetical protein
VRSLVGVTAVPATHTQTWEFLLVRGTHYPSSGTLTSLALRLTADSTGGSASVL